MPFAGFRQPSLALGLLKAAVAPLEVETKVIDATLDFAAMISPRIYEIISAWPAVDLLADRVFASGLSSPPQRSFEEYERRILSAEAPEHAVFYFGKALFDERLRHDIHLAEELVAALLDGLLDEIVKAEPTVVGFTSMSGQHTASLALAACVKSVLPDALVVFGGANCRGEMGAQLLRSFPFVDAVATGEGERVLPELIRRRLAGDPLDCLPGLCVAPKSGDEPLEESKETWPVFADLDRLPWPDYGDYFSRLAVSPLRGGFVPRVPFEASRGCWWGETSRCSFCGQASENLSYRAKSIDRALQELDELVRRHPFCPVFVTDEIVPPDYLANFFPRLRAQIPDVEIVYLQARPTLTREQMLALTSAGVRRLEVGIESLSTPVLRLIGKGTTALRCVQFLKWAHETGIDAVWNLLWGFPREEPREYERMAELVPLLTHLQPPHAVGAFRLDRFSPMFEEATRYGLRRLRPYPAYGYVYDLPPESLVELAYSFCFDYATPQSVEEYTRPVAVAIHEWKVHHERSALTFVDDGVRLSLVDRRPGFDSDELVVLDGDHRALYLACAAVRPAGALAKVLSRRAGRRVDADEVAEALRPLVDEGWMLCEGHSYLALASAQEADSGGVGRLRPECM